MRVHIIDDYDNDCEVYPEGTPGLYFVKDKDKVVEAKHPLVYEVPDELVSEYEKINKRREELKEKLFLIKRQGPL